MVRKIICVSPVFTTQYNALSWSTCDQADQVLNQRTVCLQCSLHPLPPNPKGCCFTPSNSDRAADQQDPCHFLNTPSVGLDRLGVIKPIYFTVAATGLLCNYVLFAQRCLPLCSRSCLVPGPPRPAPPRGFRVKAHYTLQGSVYLRVCVLVLYTLSLLNFTIEASKYLRV